MASMVVNAFGMRKDIQVRNSPVWVSSVGWRCGLMVWVNGAGSYRCVRHDGRPWRVYVRGAVAGMSGLNHAKIIRRVWPCGYRYVPIGWAHVGA